MHKCVVKYGNLHGKNSNLLEGVAIFGEVGWCWRDYYYFLLHVFKKILKRVRQTIFFTFE